MKTGRKMRFGSMIAMVTGTEICRFLRNLVSSLVDHRRDRQKLRGVVTTTYAGGTKTWMKNRNRYRSSPTPRRGALNPRIRSKPAVNTRVNPTVEDLVSRSKMYRYSKNNPLI